LGFLAVLLLGIVFGPTIRLLIQELHSSTSIRLGSAEVALPRYWRWSRNSGRVTVWKPCLTTFCTSAQASFNLQVTDLSVSAWEPIAKKVLREEFSKDSTSAIIDSNSGQIHCMEINVPVYGDRVVSNCLSSDLGLGSTFTGKPSLRSVFYTVLANAHRAN